MNLSELSPGEKAKIEEIQEEDLSLKLLEMGFLPGEIIHCQFRSPSGDPVAYSVGECLVALRKSESIYVKITKII